MNDLPKNTFIDSENRHWSLVISVLEYQKMKQELNIDIGNIFNDDGWLQNLIAMEDVTLFLSLIGILTDKEREAEGLSMEEFYSAFDGDTMQSSSAALVEAIINFSHPSRREALRNLVQATNKGLNELGRVVADETLLNSEKMMQELEPTIRREMQEG
jgi:hypothetical protein